MKSYFFLSLTNVSTLAHSTIERVLGEFRSIVILVDDINDELHGLLSLSVLSQCMGPQLQHTAHS